METFSTRNAAAMLGRTTVALHALISQNRITPPAKNDTGHYRWTLSDIERAREAIALIRQYRLKLDRTKGAAAAS
jgi:hypothetical protein